MIVPLIMVSSREIKVGAFVLVGMALLGLVIFMIGDERQLFNKKISYRVVFDDVEGLKRGSTIRMGGMDIGSVGQVGFSENVGDSKLYVTLNIVETQAARIRKDSRAKIDAKGLLGDKVVTLFPGSISSPVLKPGDMIPTDHDPQDLQSALGRVGSISSKADQVMSHLESLTGDFAQGNLAKDAKSSFEALSHILVAIDSGDGYVAKLLNDPNEAQRISAAIASLEKTSKELEHTMASVSAVAARVEHGPGLLHEVVYGDDSAKTVAQIGNAAVELGLLLKGVREGNGLAKAALFGDDSSQQMSGKIDRILGDLQGVMSDVRAGKGTLGALLVDPSVYEDLKMVLGNVERNKALRALVRYSIQSGEGATPVEVKDPASSGK
jgi:phospholipid/cholesterol/gamma-HCH transport system substrate-binding protein